MRFRLLFFAVLPISCAVNGGTLGTAEAVRTRSFAEHPGTNQTFDLSVQVLSPCSDRTLRMSVRDGTGACLLDAKLDEAVALRLQRGDQIRVRGHLAPLDRTGNPQVPQADRITLVSRGQLPPPETRTAEELFRGDLDCQTVRMVGSVKDVQQDEIDPNFTFIILNAGGTTVYASLLMRGTRSKVALPAPGARVSVCGMVDPYPPNNRRFLTRCLYVVNATDITVLDSAPADPFDVPDIDTLSIRRPEDILTLTGRHRARGTVVALWKNDSALLRTGPRRYLRAEFAQTELPAYGDTIEIVGFPETDLYQINLSRAIWRKASYESTDTKPLERAEAKTLHALMNDPFDSPQQHPEHRGRLLSVKGSVKGISNNGVDGARLYLEDGGYLLPVELGSCTNGIERIQVGARVEATGVCILDLENWRPNVPLPRIRSISLYLRNPSDLRILATSPWWTRERLLAALGIVLVVLTCFAVWNRLLRRLAERRGRELLNENAARFAAECRIDERTRLAAELHDSLSQNLSGISMHIDSALRFFDRNKMTEKLSIATQMLQSCREELRNCLWDLRNRALDEPDMNEAIRRTLRPQTGDAELSIRFCVPRKRISDDTAHAILRILRELASNAVRHGHAKRIKIAGADEEGAFKMSVQDDGCGFDPTRVAGVEQGHFGLQGIRERLKTMNGTMTLSSSPGHGTKVVMTICRITRE